MKEYLKNIVRFLSEETPTRNILDMDQYNRAKEFIADKVSELGLIPEFQTFTADGHECSNIIVRLPASKWADPSLPPLILGGHYDSCGKNNPGADDNASAVAGILGCLKTLKDVPLKQELIAVFFANEEPPFFMDKDMGSVVFAKSIKARNPKLAIIFEMIGMFGAGEKIDPELSGGVITGNDFLLTTGDHKAIPLMYKMENIVYGRPETDSVPFYTTAGLDTDTFRMSVQVSMSDNLSFWDQKIPAVMVTDTAHFRNPNYHQPTDTWDTLNYGAMEKVVSMYSTIIKEL